MKKAMLKIGLFVGLSIISTVVSASGQNVIRQRVEIPFDFAIATTNYAAGQYLVVVNDSRVLTIADKKGRSLFTSAVSANAAVAAAKGTKLMFDYRGDIYCLIQIVSENYGLKLRGPKAMPTMAENSSMPPKTVSLKTK